MQWNRHVRTQLDSFTGVPISRDRFFSTTQWSERLDGEFVLEAGSGAGRFTEVLLTTGADVFSFDYSTAVDANFANNGGSGRLRVFQADVVQMPLRRDVFDKIVCLGVLQHTADPAASFRSLATRLRPGGSLVVDVYSAELPTSIHWKYLLRPLTRHMNRERLYATTVKTVDILLPLSRTLRRLFGRVGPRMLPIAEFSHLPLPRELQREWSILDTFDMYSPAYDKPQTRATLRQWYVDAGFENISVERGGNGIVARGTKKRLRTVG
jgi:SAM-dependent methyltransferase